MEWTTREPIDAGRYVYRTGHGVDLMEVWKDDETGEMWAVSEEAGSDHVRCMKGEWLGPL